MVKVGVGVYHIDFDIIKHMKKQLGVLIPLLAISVVVLLGYKGFGWEKNSFQATFDLLLPWQEESKRGAWTTFENYLEFARAHNLAGVKSLSYQISTTCSDATKIEECFALMDSVYEIAKDFKQSDFRHVEEDGRQIVTYTDGPLVAILFFTKDLGGIPKVLSLRFCLENGTSQEKCIEAGSMRHDEDGDGWWDSVESLFYN